MIELVIFDWDDVITRGSTKGYYKCYHAAIEAVGVKLSRSEEHRRIESAWGSDHRSELAVVLKENLELLDQACEVYEKHLFGDTFVDSLEIVGGSRRLLEKLAKKYTLALATGINRQLLIQSVMPRFGIAPNLFRQIMSAYDLDSPKNNKPSPFMIESILQKQKKRPPSAIMVGDAKNDVLMARNAGIEPVVVLSGHLSRAEATGLGVKHIIEDVSKLEPVLNSLG